MSAHHARSILQRRESNLRANLVADSARVMHQVGKKMTHDDRAELAQLRYLASTRTVSEQERLEILEERERHSHMVQNATPLERAVLRATNPLWRGLSSAAGYVAQRTGGRIPVKDIIQAIEVHQQTGFPAYYGDLRTNT